MIKELREYYSKQYYKEQEKVKELFNNKEYDSIKDNQHTKLLCKEIELNIQGLSIEYLKEAKNMIPENSVSNEVSKSFCDEIIISYTLLD